MQLSEKQLEDDHSAEHKRERNESRVDIMIALAGELAVFWIAVISLGHSRAERYPHHIPFRALAHEK